MNVTLSLDDRLLERARRLAARRGISLNQMIRDFLSEVTGEPTPEELLAELDALWSESRGDSRGWRFNREELHDRAVLRRH
jgi:metal-responsive CopG/Arc/MetJ family transcriptional regulator